MYITGFTNSNRCAFGTDTVYTSDSLQTQYNVQDAVFAMLKGNRLNNGPVGIQTQALSASDINVYPNPGNGYFKLQTAQPCGIEVYNSLGAIVFKGAGGAGSTNDIDLHDLPDGLYYLKVKNDKGVVCLKVIKQ